MAGKYGKKAQSKVKRAMHERKKGTLRSGRSGKKVTSRKQAIAIGLAEARKAGGKVPARKSTARKSTTRKSTARKSPAKRSTKRSPSRSKKS
jgi:topoisomerase IA-like protein